mgnify:CR=1 FL=1
MIAALMYGVMLIAKMENLLNAPPEKRSKRPNRLPFAKSFSIAVGSTPGTGMCVPMRKMANMTNVKMIFCRSSGILKMLPRAESTSDHLDFATRCRNLLFCGLRETVGADRQLLREFAIAEDADTILNVLQDAGLYEHDRIDRRAVFEAVERLNVDFSDVLAQTFLKPRFGRRR